MKSSRIIEKLFTVKNDEKHNPPNIIEIFNKLSSIPYDTVSTIPGYIKKILLNLMRNSPKEMMKILNVHPVYENLIERIDNDSICEILFNFIFLNRDKEVESIQIVEFQKTNLSIIESVIKKIKTEYEICKFNHKKFILDFSVNKSLDNFYKSDSIEKIENSFILLTKILKFSFSLKDETSSELFTTIGLGKREEIINSDIDSNKNHETFYEKILNHLSLSKFSYSSDLNDNKSSAFISEDDVKLIQSIFSFLLNLLEVALIPTFQKNLNDVITSSLFVEDILKSMNENVGSVINNTNSNSIDDEIVSSNPNTDSNTNNNPNNNKLNENKIPNLFNVISTENKILLVEKFVTIFPQLFNLANRIKISYKTKKLFKTIDENVFIIPVSQSYLISLDIFIYMLILKNSKFKEYLTASQLQLFEILIDDVILYRNNSFLLNKIVKIFEIVLFDEFYEEIKFIFLNKNNHAFKTLLNSVNFKEFINLEEKTLVHKNYTTNYSHMMRLLNYFYVTIQNSENFKLNDEELDSFESHLSVYLNLTTRDLLANEIQNVKELKYAGDEEMNINLEKNCKEIISY